MSRYFMNSEAVLPLGNRLGSRWTSHKNFEGSAEPISLKSLVISYY